MNSDMESLHSGNTATNKTTTEEYLHDHRRHVDLTRKDTVVDNDEDSAIADDVSGNEGIDQSAPFQSSSNTGNAAFVRTKSSHQPHVRSHRPSMSDKPKRFYNSTLRPEFYVNDDNEDDSNSNIAYELNRKKSIARSISDHAPSLSNPMRKRRDSTKSMESLIKRRGSRSSIDSEADSRASRSSQETEEDVCFPMLREHVRVRGIDFDEIEEFIKEEREEQELLDMQARKNAYKMKLRRSSTNSVQTSATSMKYTPKHILAKFMSRKLDIPEEYAVSSNSSKSLDEANLNMEEKLNNVSSGSSDNSSSTEQVKFGGTRITSGGIHRELPDRFSFFSSENEETIHSPDIPSLVSKGQSVQELFKNGEGTWWLDCTCPTDAEMKMLAKAFGIHPLTAEDIRMQETREKVELFRSYYFVCFHTFEPDNESEDYLEPINVYIVVFREGVVSFHFSPIIHPANVRRRVRQLRDYVDVSADWLCYALIDDITDGFAPVITGIEYEADAIEDSVFVARETDYASMLQRIGESRRKVMTLMRLLSGKADVIKMFAKRCQDEAAVQTVSSHANVAGFNYGNPGTSFGPMPGVASPQPIYHESMGFSPTPTPVGNNNLSQSYFNQQNRQNFTHVQQPRADIALYLGDIQDHVVTMFQNLLAYEKIFSRSHGNYLAQLQVESFNSNNKLTNMFSKITLLGTIIVPLNVITGLFGMNVHVPGEGIDTLAWFFGIIGVMITIIVVCVFLSSLWLKRVNAPDPSFVSSSKRSIKSLRLRLKSKDAAKSIISFPNKYE